MIASHDVRLYFFDVYMPAESIRMLFDRENVKFADIRYDHRDYLERKQSGEFKGKFEFG